MIIPQYPTIPQMFKGSQPQPSIADFAPVLDRSVLAKIRAELSQQDTMTQYRFDPAGYIQNVLKWTPWAGTPDHPGQMEVLEAYRKALLQLHERRDFELGNLSQDDLEHWQPGETIKYILRVEAGHNVGKTFELSGLVNHFFDCFPSIIYTFAPSYPQINDLLWKYIRKDRINADLPGKPLKEPRMQLAHDRFAVGRATNDAHGAGTERIQGQHHPYIMLVVDEAEGVAEFVFNAIDSMSSGGIVIVIMMANPKTRQSRFYRMRTRDDVANFRMSCLYHPNVLANKDIVPGAVRRDYVLSMAFSDPPHVKIVDKHDPDLDTFQFPWEVEEQGEENAPIYAPDGEYCFRVLGIPPSNESDRTFISPGRFAASCKRVALMDDLGLVLLGVDVARFGADRGTIWVRQADAIWCAKEIRGMDLYDYRMNVKRIALSMRDKGATRCHIRVDGTGIGGGLVDDLQHDLDLREAFIEFRVFDVQFGGMSHRPDLYANMITGLYAEAGESLKGVSILNPPNELEVDLTAREFAWVNRAGRDIKILTSKEKFREEFHHSPDHGDGFVMAIVPPSVLGADYEVDIPVRQYHLIRSVDEALSWPESNDERAAWRDMRAAAGVEVELDNEGKHRLYVVIRAPWEGRVRDLHIAYLWGDPWVDLARMLMQFGVHLTVINSRADYSASLDFATRLKSVGLKVYLAAWGAGNAPMVRWNDKPQKMTSQKGEEAGYKYLVTINEAKGMQWSLDRWVKGVNLSPPILDLVQDMPMVGLVPSPLVAKHLRTNEVPGPEAVADVYWQHLLRTGLRRIYASPEAKMAGEITWEITTMGFPPCFAFAGLLADVALERRNM